MNNFKFRYESMLELLEKKQDSVKNHLSQAYNLLNKEKNKLESLVSKDAEYSNLIKDRTSNGCKLMVLRHIEGYRKDLNIKIDLQNDIIYEREKEVNTVRNKLIEISKEKRIMEKLKEKKLEEFNVSLKKMEERKVDGLVSYKNSLQHR